MTTIKIVYESEIRRCKINSSTQPFQELTQIIQESYGLKVFELRYYDDENDLCLITSEDEMKEALRVGTGGKTLKLFLTRPEAKSKEDEPVLDVRPTQPTELVQPELVQPELILPVQPSEPEEQSKPIDVPVSEPKSEPERESTEREPERNERETELELEREHEPEPEPEPEAQPEAQPQLEQKVQKPSDLHENIRCDGCDVFPIQGIRYKCTSCEDFDLCQACESKNDHPMDHVLLKVKVALPDSFKFVSPFPKWVFADQQSQGQETSRPKAHFVRDVTIPDGTALRPGQRVLKTWSMKNSGKVYWPRDTKLVFVGGQLRPSEDEEQPLIPLAASGEVVDVSVRLQMPEKPGRYTGYYRLSHGEGSRFGNRIWIDVLVSDSAASVKGVFDKAIEVVTKVFKGEKPKEAKKNEKEGDEKAKEPVQPKFEFEAELLQLRAMGFSDDAKSKELLTSYKGNVQRVANQLLSA